LSVLNRCDTNLQLTASLVWDIFTIRGPAPFGRRQSFVLCLTAIHRPQIWDELHCLCYSRIYADNLNWGKYKYHKE